MWRRWGGNQYRGRRQNCSTLTEFEAGVSESESTEKICCRKKKKTRNKLILVVSNQQRHKGAVGCTFEIFLNNGCSGCGYGWFSFSEVPSAVPTPKNLILPLGHFHLVQSAEWATLFTLFKAIFLTGKCFIVCSVYIQPYFVQPQCNACDP